MAPPKDPCECYCLHCRRTFSSDQMWFQKVVGDPQGFEGFWMCPTPNCGGAGFTFDIFPTDPAHPANAGWHSFDDEEGEEGEEPEWDPDEPKYQDFDDDYEDEDDLEGEEWKYGLEPGQRPEPEWMAEERKRWEEEEKKYDEPDTRPRELDWTDREDRKSQPRDPNDSTWGEEDIPF